MRVIAGQFRSRRLRTLPGLSLRPTSDRLRETLFNVLASGPVPLEGSIWIDVFAGSGAVGIEALSRGASMVFFVESHHAAAGVIRQNLESLQIADRAEILERDASQALRQLANRHVRCNFCFVDPPYADASAYKTVFTTIAGLPILAAHGIAIAEHDRHFDPGDAFPGPAGMLQRQRKLEQGDAVLSFYRQD